MVSFLLFFEVGQLIVDPWEIPLTDFSTFSYFLFYFIHYFVVKQLIYVSIFHYLVEILFYFLSMCNILWWL